LRKRLAEQYQGEIRQKESENEHLRHCVKEHEKRLQIITPEVEKMRTNLAAKNDQIAQLESRLERSRKEAETQLLRTRQET
jgi:septal ring factor EnvC (AmiA/AmiB activator)